MNFIRNVLGFGGNAPQDELPTEFTIESLAKYNGRDGGRILIALRGVVYDVTKGRDFYGPGGGYNVFAGKDASRNLAKMSFEAADLNRNDLDDLTEEQQNVLNDWIKKYDEKYTRVGTIAW